MKMARYCYVTCKTRTRRGQESKISFHRIPKKEEDRSKWHAFIGTSCKTNPHVVVCSKHFLQSNFVYKKYGSVSRRFLKPGAYPTLLQDTYGTIENSQVIAITEPANNCAVIKRENDGDLATGTNVYRENTLILVKSETIDNHAPSTHEIHSDAVAGTDISKGNAMLIANAATTDNCGLLNQTSNDELVTDIDIKDEKPCCAILQETATDLCNTMSPQLQKLMDNYSDGIVKTFSNPKCIAGISRENFTSDHSYVLFEDYTIKMRNEIKLLNQQVVCLSEKVKELQEILDYLKQIGLLCD